MGAVALVIEYGDGGSRRGLDYPVNRSLIDALKLDQIERRPGFLLPRYKPAWGSPMG
jgi:hypothetical protein